MTQEQAVAAERVPPPSQEEVEEVLDRLVPVSAGQVGADESNLIGLLQDVQDHFGYLPAPALDSLSRRIRIPLSRIYGVVSFYAQFYTAPRGKHTIRCCRGTACHVKGTARVLDMIRQTLRIEEGQTTPDLKFYLETVACLGTCFLAPVMMIDDQYFGTLTPQRVEGILKNYATGAP
jgi:NADH-quinone oxidoreductase subunit E